MSCPTIKKLCNHLVISQSVTFADDQLVVNLPQRAYENDEKYCIVIGQTIPDTTTINAPVVFTIGTDTTTTYPLVNQSCVPVTARFLQTRTRYSTMVHTDVATGVFALMGRIPCAQCYSSAAPSLPIETPDTPTP